MCPTFGVQFKSFQTTFYRSNRALFNCKPISPGCAVCPRPCRVRGRHGRQELHGDGVHDRREYVDVARAWMTCTPSVALKLLSKSAKTKSSPPRTDSPHIGFDFVQQTVVRRDDDDGHVFVHQCQRAIVSPACGIGFGVDVGDFFQLQRAFESDREVDAST